MLKAKVYWNFHRKCFSVQVNGRVVAHATFLQMFLPEFRVSRAGRARVLATRRKNVHAFIVGHIVSDVRLEGITDIKRVTYNPYRHETFVDAETGQEIDKADAVTCVAMPGQLPEVRAYWAQRGEAE